MSIRDSLIKDNIKFTEKVLESLKNGKPVEVNNDVTCRCSGSTHYAFTAFMCHNCKKWSRVFNYYDSELTKPITDIGRITISTRPSSSGNWIDLSGNYDAFSTEVYSSFIMSELIKGYPTIVDAWTCGLSNTNCIVSHVVSPFETAMKLKNPEEISAKLLDQLDQLEKYDYEPSVRSFCKSNNQIRGISSLFSYNNITDTLCLPVPSRISGSIINGPEIKCKDIVSSVTTNDLRKYLSNKLFVNEFTE